MNLAGMRTVRGAVLLLAAALLAPAVVQALEWPSRPVRLIVPLTPGSGADIVARVLARSLQDIWSQPVVIENRPGAGGQIGTREVVQATDDHTLMVQSASHASNPALYKSLPYDPAKDLVDISLLATAPYVLVTASAGPYESVADIVQAAKAKPGALPFASAGLGSVTHLTAELFTQAAGIRMMHIPFKGSPDAVTDVAAGRAAFYVAPLPTVAGMLKDGKIRPVAVTSARRVAELPDVPTVAESGYPGFEAELWVGMWAPASLPAPVVAKVAGDVAMALRKPELQEQYAKAGNQVRIMTQPEFAAFVRQAIETNKQLVKSAGIQPL